MALLGLKAQRGDRARIQALDADGLAGFLAVAVAAVLKPNQGRMDFGNQLALPVARAVRCRIVGIAFFWLLFVVPETPKWLIGK